MGKRPLVVHVVGARPNYMKIAPIYSALSEDGRVDQRLVHTGQHYDPALKDDFLTELPLPEPHVSLRVGSGSHADQTGRALILLGSTFVELRPDVVVVAGDVNSTLAGALAAVKLGTPVCHVESGLRSHDWSMPEEHNRRLTDHVSTLLLTHSESANQNLESEGIPSSRVAFVGNTMVDSLLSCLDTARKLAKWRDFGLEAHEYVLVTLHRPALVDSPRLLRETLGALGELAQTLPVVFPLHPRTQGRLAHEGLELPSGVIGTPALPYHSFVSLETGARAVVTDSGGVQEETTALGVRCFTLRDNTERPVTLTHGTNELLGLNPEKLRGLASRLDGEIVSSRPPFWDGHAGQRSAEAIARLALGGAHAERARVLTV
jgi:UDP-N-acetylglucosamine 2-epimerase (non-hydrolysing)